MCHPVDVAKNPHGVAPLTASHLANARAPCCTKYVNLLVSIILERPVPAYLDRAWSSRESTATCCCRSIGYNICCCQYSANMLARANLLQSKVGARVQPAGRTVLAPPVRPCKVYAKGEVIPSPAEEKSSAHEAFMHAFEASKPPSARIPGLQEFAAAIWERRRRIPSTTYNDPLDHIFTEFDEDGDGHLTSEEIATALKSRNVEITPDQIKEFIRAADENNNGTVERAEFPQFIFHMAIADLKSVQSME